MAYAMYLEPLDEYSSPKSIQLVGEVVDVDALMEEQGASKSSCDGLTSATVPRYENDNMNMLFFESKEVAEEFSRMVRNDFINEVQKGNLHPRGIPAWATNPNNTSFISSARTTALVPTVRNSFPLEVVSDSQLISASEAYLLETGRVATESQLLGWIEVNRAWDLV